MSTEGFHLEPSGEVGVIRLARPPVNAVTFELIDRLAEAVADPHGWCPDAAALVLAADGPHFSAGMDRSELAALDRSLLSRAAEALGKVVAGPLPLVSAVHGSAAGTGFILAACSDVLVIDLDAEVWLPEVELGMLGGAAHARRWLPMPLVRRMVLTGERIDGSTFHRFGAVCPPPGSTVEQTAMGWATRIVGMDRNVVAEARAVLADLELDPASVHRREMSSTPLPPTTNEDQT